VDRFAREEKRSRSQIIEIALEQFLRERTPSESEIVTSSGRFEGPFSREETYAR
jgi:metal-responsive CopG/Arc/MetJ family transcriptional regulator